MSKRPPRCLTRLMKARGDLGAVPLGDMVESGTAEFTHATWGRHEHCWIPGADIEVCTKCGKTQPKGTAAGVAPPPLPEIVTLREFVAQMEREYGRTEELTALRAAAGGREPS